MVAYPAAVLEVSGLISGSGYLYDMQMFQSLGIVFAVFVALQLKHCQ